MDPFKNSAKTEGCSSSESGWTSYIASAMQDEFAGSEVNYNIPHNIEDHFEENSDDSMVSDASSAPAPYQYKQSYGQGSHTNVRLKHDKGDCVGKDHKEGKKEAKRSGESSGKSKRKLGGQGKSRK